MDPSVMLQALPQPSAISPTVTKNKAGLQKQKTLVSVPWNAGRIVIFNSSVQQIQ
jgi:hypothetical protein